MACLFTAPLLCTRTRCVPLISSSGRGGISHYLHRRTLNLLVYGVAVCTVVPSQTLIGLCVDRMMLPWRDVWHGAPVCAAPTRRGPLACSLPNPFCSGFAYS